MSKDSSAFHAETVEYIGRNAGFGPAVAGTSVMRRIVVPNSASVTVPSKAGFGSTVIGCGNLSVTSPAHRFVLAGDGGDAHVARSRRPRRAADPRGNRHAIRTASGGAAGGCFSQTGASSAPGGCVGRLGCADMS